MKKANQQRYIALSRIRWVEAVGLFYVIFFGKRDLSDFTNYLLFLQIVKNDRRKRKHGKMYSCNSYPFQAQT